MKKIILIGLLVLSFMFIGCSTSESDGYDYYDKRNSSGVDYNYYDFDEFRGIFINDITSAPDFDLYIFAFCEDGIICYGKNQNSCFRDINLLEKYCNEISRKDNITRYKGGNLRWTNVSQDNQK